MTDIRIDMDPICLFMDVQSNINSGCAHLYHFYRIFTGEFNIYTIDSPERFTWMLGVMAGAVVN